MLKEASSSSRKIKAIGFGGFVTASTRYRMLQFLDGLDKKGLSIDFRCSNEFKCWSDVSQFLFDEPHPADIVWIQKKLFPANWIWRIARRCQIVFDFDDAIWTSERSDRSKFTKWRAKFKLDFVLKRSALVMAGNHYLAQYASRHAKNVVVIPTVVDADIYPIKKHVDRSPLVLGWIGHSGNFKYLQNLAGVFQKLRELIDFKLLVIADKDFQLPFVEVVNRRWSAETEIADILEIDIGLMPLEDSDWTRGKCAFKAIQYMAAGIPAVASNVGANADLITSGKNGYLVRTDEDWIYTICELYCCSNLRTKLGYEARGVVVDSYSLKHNVNLICDAMRNLVLIKRA